MNLIGVNCPSCDMVLYLRYEIKKSACSYADCLRCCQKCGIGFSNAHRNPTIIYQNYTDNVPKKLRKGLEDTLNRSLNGLNRSNKKCKFGFSTSEDALTWSFFKYFVLKDKLRDLLKIMGVESRETSFNLYLWGVPVCKPNKNSNLIERFIEFSDFFKEEPNKRTEPDVIIELNNRIILIEVKYRSPNDFKKDTRRLQKYCVPNLVRHEVIDSGQYELLRNWAFATRLSEGGGSFEVINLALQKQFKDRRLQQFKNALKAKTGNLGP